MALRHRRTGGWKESLECVSHCAKAGTMVKRICFWLYFLLASRNDGVRKDGIGMHVDPNSARTSCSRHGEAKELPQRPNRAVLQRISKFHHHVHHASATAVELRAGAMIWRGRRQVIGKWDITRPKTLRLGPRRALCWQAFHFGQIRHG